MNCVARWSSLLNKQCLSLSASSAPVQCISSCLFPSPASGGSQQAPDGMGIEAHFYYYVKKSIGTANLAGPDRASISRIARMAHQESDSEQF